MASAGDRKISVFGDRPGDGRGVQSPTCDASPARAHILACKRPLNTPCRQFNSTPGRWEERDWFVSRLARQASAREPNVRATIAPRHLRWDADALLRKAQPLFEASGLPSCSMSL